MDNKSDVWLEPGVDLRNAVLAAGGADDKFPTWQTVKLGTHKNFDELKGDLYKGAMFIESRHIGLAVELMALMAQKAFTLAPVEISVELVRVTISDLGFTELTSLRNILTRGEEFGLKRCVPEVGLQLLCNFWNQLKAELLWIAMDPITDSNGDTVICCIHGFENCPWIESHRNNFDSSFSPTCEFVFSK